MELLGELNNQEEPTLGLVREARTVRRRMTEYDLSVHALYTQLMDQQLDGIVIFKPNFQHVAIGKWKATY